MAVPGRLTRGSGPATHDFPDGSGNVVGDQPSLAMTRGQPDRSIFSSPGITHPTALAAGCLRRCSHFQRRRAARLGSAARMASEAAVPPPAPLFMEFVPEPSQATPSLGATAAAGASARAPAGPPPAPLFMEFVSEPSPTAPPLGATAAAGASAHAPAVPPPAPRFREVVPEPSQATP